MSYKFNPFTSNFDLVGGGANSTTWKNPVANQASLPATDNTEGDARITLDTQVIYVWDGLAWVVVSNSELSSKLVTVNAGGAAGSGDESGLAVEENSVITGYVETSSDRNSWALKAPNTAGVAVITPGAGGIALNQSSHNAVTIGTANGLSLATQAISLALASTSTTGALSNTDWNTFNDKQAAGSYITDLTGDVTAAGPGSVAAAVAFVGGSSAADVHTAELAANGASSSGTPDAIVKYDSNSDFTAGTITASLNGSASGNLRKSTGDIDQDSTTLADNTTSPASVAGLNFANGSVRSFEALVSVTRGATYSAHKLLGVQRGSDWIMSESMAGDDTGVAFTISTSGQVQYTSTNTGSSASAKFRATITNV